MLNDRIQIIAEVKTHSPFGWESPKSWDELFEVADSIGDMLSIHTDPRWHGSFEILKKARKLTEKPILAKGIHHSDKDIQMAIDCGADWVLVVGRIPKIHLEKCLIELYTLEELASLPKGVRAVWNSRNLTDGSRKSETFEAARKSWDGWLCQASNIQTVDDIKTGADAVLVGTNLEKFAQSLAQNNRS